MSNLKLELERRQAEALRREAILQKSRDELGSSAAANEREAAAALASARDEEAGRVKRLEAERSRLNDALLVAQSDGAAAAASARDKADSLAGEVAAMKAELHGASIEKRAALEETSRLRRRTEEAEERLTSTMAELHALRLESTETSAHRGRLAEVEASASVAQEKLTLQLSFVQKEVHTR